MERTKAVWEKKFEELKRAFLDDFSTMAKAYVFYFVSNYDGWVTQNQIDDELMKYGYTRTDSLALCGELSSEGKFEFTGKPKLAYRIKTKESTH
jgi:hypothetical protein